MEGNGSVYTDSAMFLDPSYGNKFIKKTHKDIIDKYSEMQKEIPDIKDSIIEVLTDSNKIAVEFIAIGSLPTGNKLKLPICNVWTLKNGKIIKDATYYDNK